MAFTKVCAVAELAPGEARRYEDSPEAIAIFNLDGEFFAIGDKCTHGDWPLSDGYVDGDEVECPLHQGTFCIRTGAARQYPACEPVRVFPVRIAEGFVHVDPDAGAYTT